MVRGPKKHLKRSDAPKHWMLDKMGGMWAPRPSTGPHKMRECLPLILILRQRLKYALTGREATQICMQKLVKVDNRVRTDVNFPAGFMDVISLDKAGDNFRLLYDTKGRFVLQPLSKDEANYKLCRVTRVGVTKKKTPYVVTHDARTIRFADPLIKVGDTVKVDVKTNKITDFVKYETGNLVMCTKGRNTGRIGVLKHQERHAGSFDIVQVVDAANNTFATRSSNVFIIGKGNKPMVTVPKANGVRLSIIQETAARNAKQ
jgi:small subunit ribosomal protein S4e